MSNFNIKAMPYIPNDTTASTNAVPTTGSVAVAPNNKMKELIELLELIKSRGNKVEIVNGKIYEVRRKLIGDMNDYK